MLSAAVLGAAAADAGEDEGCHCEAGDWGRNVTDRCLVKIK